MGNRSKRAWRLLSIEGLTDMARLRACGVAVTNLGRDSTCGIKLKVSLYWGCMTLCFIIHHSMGVWGAGHHCFGDIDYVE